MTTEYAPAHPGLLWALAVATALAAGTASYYIGEQTKETFQPSEEARKASANRMMGPLQKELPET